MSYLLTLLAGCTLTLSASVTAGEPVEKFITSWVCHHPENKINVYFETFPIITATPNVDPSRLYLLAFEDFTVAGYLYIKWDQTDTDSQEALQTHLDEIFADITLSEPLQRQNAPPSFNLDYAYGSSPGTPYNLITVSGDGFLFGFAYTQKNPLIAFDVSNLIEKIKWKKLP